MLAEISSRLGDHFKSWWNKATCKWQKKLSICPSQMLNFSQSFITFSRYHSFSIYANFSEKTTFQGVNVSFSENFVYLLNEWDHGVIILNRSNNSVLLYWKIYWNRQVFDLIRAPGISMKPETLRHQASSSKFYILYLKVLIWV